MSERVESKEGQPIKVGDTVYTRFRGGKREGKVEAIIVNQRELENIGDVGVKVTNPPKVVFTDQHGHIVSHNPSTLTHSDTSGTK